MEEEKFYDKLLRPALFVTEIPENFDPKRTPQTGEEYLQHVKYEANQCREWLKADISKEKISNEHYYVQEPNTCLSAPKEFIPNTDWQQKTVADFSAFRLHLQKIKTSKTDIQYSQFFPDIQFWQKKCAVEPKLTDLLTLNQPSLCKLLEYIIIWLETIKDGESISYTIGAWLYAVLCCLEKPLLPDTCYSLREIARKCSEIRRKLESNSSEDLHKSLNVFICIIALYFNNNDLVDSLNEL